MKMDMPLRGEFGTVVTPEALAALPPDLLTILEQATKRSNMSQIYELITEIRTHDAAVADTLMHLADEFQYEAILALLANIRRKHHEEPTDNDF